MGVPVLWWFVGIVGSCMFLAGVFVAAGGRGARFDWREELLGGLFFAAMGALCAAVAYSQFRRFRPARLTAIPGATLTAEPVEVCRGETVTATITHGAAEGIQVGLVCEERYDLQSTSYTKAGTIRVRQTNQGTAYEEWIPVPAEAGEHAFRFTVPLDAPCSYEGDCLSYAWRVSARRPARLQADPRLDQPLWVRA